MTLSFGKFQLALHGPYLYQPWFQFFWRQNVAVAGDIFDGVVFCAVLSPIDVFEEIWLNWVSSWEFSYLLF